MPKKKLTEKIEIKILDLQPLPASVIEPELQRYLISCEFKQGKAVWRRAWRVQYDRPISLEEFKRDLAEMDISPKDQSDYFSDIKASINKPFEIEK